LVFFNAGDFKHFLSLEHFIKSSVNSSSYISV